MYPAYFTISESILRLQVKLVSLGGQITYQGVQATHFSFEEVVENLDAALFVFFFQASLF